MFENLLDYGCGCSSFISDDLDYHESLRAYARAHFGAPEDEGTVDDGAKTKVLRDDTDFALCFRRVLERQGWPVHKCGQGAANPRCFQLRENDLSWGSKHSSGRDRAVSLSDIVDISIQPFPGGPPGADDSKMMIIVLDSGQGLKILCNLVCDCVVLDRGFRLLANMML